MICSFGDDSEHACLSSQTMTCFVVPRGLSGGGGVGVSNNVEAVAGTLLACKMLRFFMASFTLVRMCSFGIIFGVVGLS